MKKILTFILCVFMFIGANAQLASDGVRWEMDDDYSFTHSGVFANPEIGYFMPGYSSGGIDLGLQLGYRLRLSDSFAWDIAKIGVHGNGYDFARYSSLSFQSGLRYNSPVLFSKYGLYAELAAGYGCGLKESDGFVFETGVGLNLNSKISLGIIFRKDYIEFYAKHILYPNEHGCLALRLGINF